MTKAYLILPNRCYGGEVIVENTSNLSANLTLIAPDSKLKSPVWNDASWEEMDQQLFDQLHDATVQPSLGIQMINFLGTQVGMLTQRVTKLEGEKNG